MSSQSTKIPPPVPRLDAARIVEELDRHHGLSLELLGAAPGGEVGAAFVRWPDGREGVLTQAGDAAAGAGEHLRSTMTMLALAKTRGVPVPQYGLVVQIDDLYAVVQERLPGAPPDDVDGPLVDQMVAATDQWAGLLTDLDAEPSSLYLNESGPGFCLHESLEHYDNRTRRLLGQVREIGRSGPGVLTGDDLVHLDYHSGNVLVDSAGRLTGIVDWDGWARGDRWFSLEVLAFDLTWRCTDTAVRDRLDALITAAVPADHLRAYRASLSLRLVDWVIRHDEPRAVDYWLAVATNRLNSP